RDFLEKIIQGSFHVPALSVDEIGREFSEQLSAFLKGTHLENSLDSKRLSELFFDVLWEYLSNARHINRLISSVSFYLAQLSSDTAIEVDPVDLIGIETLRLFETDIYEALPRYRDYLTDSADAPRNLFLRDDEKEVRERKLGEILQLGKTTDGDRAARLLAFLFPPLVGKYRDQSESLIKHRVSRGENFNRYFAFRSALNEVSELELRHLVASAVSPTEAERSFQSFLDRGAFGELLTRLDHSLE